MYTSFFVFLPLLLLFPTALAVDRSKFRTCASTGFCHRFRDTTVPSLPSTAPARGHWKVVPGSIRFSDGKSDAASEVLRARLASDGAVAHPGLNIVVQLYPGDTFRVQITEDKDRWQPLDLLIANPVQSHKLVPAGDAQLPDAIRSLPADSFVAVTSASSSSQGVLLVLHLAPLRVELYSAGVLLVTANDRSLLHFEWQRSSIHNRALSGGESDADRHQGKEVLDYGEDGLATYTDGTREERRQLSSTSGEAGPNAPSEEDWAESFGGHSDSKPRGPMSVGMDFSFPFAQHVYGIPEHTSPLSLPTTKTSSAGLAPKYNEPYRLYNLDVFDYELDNTMALYGHIPFMSAHGLVGSTGQSVGVFWFNPSETFVDVSDGTAAANRGIYKETHWMSESGNVDFFLFAGPSPGDVFAQFTGLVGRQELPPLFALGYHQCRWNYRDERDVATVEGMFEQLDYPMDVIWLDIEHTDGKRYFTWDKLVFPSPIEMQRNVSAHGRKMVTIVDPHIKRDPAYHIHKEATEKHLYIRNKDGADFDGWCWPGSSSYLDFTSPSVREWWGQQFALQKYVGSTMDLFTWNDMNEPSVFNGPEVSMPKDATNLAGVEHREWHNLYGIYMQQATSTGLEQRKDVEKSSWIDWTRPSSSRKTESVRPFVLSRAFWAGSQRFGAIWTGDNKAEWGHLKIAAPMLLSINLAGLSFSGADVGGFMGEPGAELFTRWYQAGAFTPFFRGHAHHDTKRREPWVFGEPYTSILRATSMLRYTLLPYWYSVFEEAQSTGVPVMRTMFTEFPNDVETFAMDDQWMVGNSLLVKPVTDAGKTTVEVYLPALTSDRRRQLWYDLYSMTLVSSTGPRVTVNAPLEKIPVFVRGGKVVPRKMRLRRSSKLMFYDPYTLSVCPDSEGNAIGQLYMDDEYSTAHKKDPSASVVREFVLTSRNKLSNRRKGGDIASPYNAPNTLERVIVAGQMHAPTRVTVVLKSSGQESSLQFFYDESSKTLSIKKPDVLMTEDWDILFSY